MRQSAYRFKNCPIHKPYLCYMRMMQFYHLKFSSQFSINNIVEMCLFLDKKKKIIIKKTHI